MPLDRFDYLSCGGVKVILGLLDLISELMERPLVSSKMGNNPVKKMLRMETV